jgi:hypothetical protein
MAVASIRTGDPAVSQGPLSPRRAYRSHAADRVTRAGPLTLSIGEDLAQIPRRQLVQPQGSGAIAFVTGNQPVTVRIAPSSRGLLALRFTPDPAATDRVAAVRTAKALTTERCACPPPLTFGLVVLRSTQACA